MPLITIITKNTICRERQAGRKYASQDRTGQDTAGKSDSMIDLELKYRVTQQKKRTSK
jgi:hypothetical protein